MRAPTQNCKHAFGIHLLVWIAALCLVLIGCNSGGGNEENGSPHLSYSGINTQAAIREDNAETLALKAFNTGINATSFTSIATLSEMEPTSGDSSRGFLFDLALTLDDTVGDIAVLTTPVEDLRAAIISNSVTIKGSCGGIGAINLDMDTDTGTYDGGITFSNFCEDGIFINGDAGFYGVFNLMIGKLDSFTLAFDYLTVITGSESMVTDGEIYMDVSGITTMATMNMLIQEIDTGDVSKIENYQMDITDGLTHFDIAVNGRYNHPDYGYVDVMTPHPFHVNNGNSYPSYGAMILNGETGSAGGPTRALLTIQSDMFQIEADTDGDGEYDDHP